MRKRIMLRRTCAICICCERNSIAGWRVKAARSLRRPVSISCPTAHCWTLRDGLKPTYSRTYRWADVASGGKAEGQAPHMGRPRQQRSEEHTSELQSLMRISYAVFCLKKKKKQTLQKNNKNKTKITKRTVQECHNKQSEESTQRNNITISHVDEYRHSE